MRAARPRGPGLVAAASGPLTHASHRAPPAAYDVLSDPERRSNYDKFGHAGEGEEGPGYSSFEDAFQAHGYGDVEDTAFNWVMLVLIGALSVLPAVLAVRARGKPRSRRDALMEARERSAAATRAADPQEDAAEAERRRRERERRAERRQRRKAADGPRVERDGAVAAAVRAGQEEEARAREAEREADLRRRQAGQRLVDAPSAADAPWTEGELSALAKGVAKFPGGTRDRWGHIARHVASVGMPHARTPDECAKQARTSAPAIRKIQREARGVGQDAGARLAEQEAAVRQEGEREGGSGGGGDGDKDKDRAWTVAEQKALEEALKACPPSMPTKERWRGIASRVPGRTAKECVARFKEVRAQVAAKAAMAKA